MIKYQKDNENIATLILDMSGQARNVINHEIVTAFHPVIRHLQAEKSKRALNGVIITSAKRNFLEGGNLDYLYQAKDPAEVSTFTKRLKQLFRDLEYPGVPVVAAINGTALGAGFGLALACHHRIALNDTKIRIGLPEVALGLVPGGGSVLRLMWLFGIEKAFHLLTAGRRYTPREAVRAGIIDELVENESELIEKAKAWLKLEQAGRRAWDTPKAKIPTFGKSIESTIRKLNVGLVKNKRYQYPADHTILNILATCARLDFDTASQIESQHYTNLVCNQEAKNMIRAFWYDYMAIQEGQSRPKGFGRFRPKKVGVIGAGRMGCGIATSCAVNGLEVVIKDVSKVIAEQGKRQVEQNVKDLIATNKVADEAKEVILNRVTTTDKAQDFEGCDLVLEAVFENANLKQKVTQESEEYLDEYGFIGSNTVSIPISKLAETAEHPENFVGLHFFSPAHRIPIIEIVKGKQTSDETVARAYDFAKVIRKIPIVVKDSWGFYAARVLNTFILESITMLSEGYSAALIENLGLEAGMPKGGLAWADELGFSLVLNYEKQAAERYGAKYVQHPAVTVLQKMTTELARVGGYGKNGFYNATKGEDTSLAPELEAHFSAHQSKYDKKELIDRFLIAQVLEAGWCLEEGVIKSTAEANLGSIYGWGFPARKGGVIQYIMDYGKRAFIERCRQLEERFGQRFQVPRYLKKEVEV